MSTELRNSAAAGNDSAAITCVIGDDHPAVLTGDRDHGVVLDVEAPEDEPGGGEDDEIRDEETPSPLHQEVREDRCERIEGSQSLTIALDQRSGT